MIVVSAATGRLGRLVVEKLLEHVPAHEVAVAVRKPKRASDLAARGVEVRRGDYDDQKSLVGAFEGADHLLFISSPEIETSVRVAQHMGVIQSAKDARVRHVAYTSFFGAENDQPGPMYAHYATERALEQSGLPYTLLRNPFYTEDVISPPFLQGASLVGEIRAASGNRAVNSATRADLAEAAVAVVRGNGHENRAYDLAGRPWTYPQLAATLTRLGDRPVVYHDADIEEMGEFGWIFSFIRSGALERATPDLELLLGRRSTGLEHYVASALAASPVGE